MQYVFVDPNDKITEFDSSADDAIVVLKALAAYWEAEPMTLGFVDGPQLSCSGNNQEVNSWLKDNIQS